MKMTVQLYYSAVFTAMFVLVVGCSAGSMGSTTEAQCTGDTIAVELSLPQVPSMLREPEERAGYIVVHFWDAMDFSDTLRSHNEAFMEQNIANFLSLFPHASPDALTPGVQALLKRAAADEGAIRLVSDLAEHYLADPNSPMRCEDYYMVFLEQILELPVLPDGMKERTAYHLAMARKNRPGSIATDFAFTTREGKRQRLSAYGSGNVLLIFYDPACDHCTDILWQLQASAEIGRLIADGSLTVLAIYTEGDRALWQRTCDAMPREWIVGIDESGIVEHELYSLPAMPVIYLLTPNNRVIIKDYDFSNSPLPFGDNR